MTQAKVGWRAYVVTQVVNAVDADAQAFITAAGITNLTQASAINTLVNDLKTYGLWTKMKALYPMVGGTASSHKFNLKDPRDLDAAYRLVFNGGWTHTSNGALPNGTTGYADTFFNPSLISGWHNNHNLSIYMKTQTPTGNGWHLGYGYSTNGDPVYGLAIRRSSSPTNSLIYDSGNYSQNGRIFDFSSDARGFWSGNASSSSNRVLYKNGSSVLSNTTTTVTGTPPNDVMTIGALNGTSGSTKYYLSGINSFTSFSDSLTPTENSNLNTAVQAFQTTLSRQN